ncbi:phospholipase D-like domain-containing protein [Aquibacillus kalidii]|uniref:hypothetical protein n=1 Tax=Aquibacillus kalidii TaxID=2762597 RepID=UPI0016454A66|nr:hypothetical protein [Aquibacillus kalidii]
MELIRTNLEQFIKEEFEKATSSILIISPFLNNLDGVERLLNGVKARNLELNYLTKTPGMEYLTGLSDLKDLKKISQIGFHVKLLQSIQANLCLIDKKKILMGPLNFGSTGPTKGIMFNKELTEKEAEIIHKQYWAHPNIVEFNSTYLEEIIKIQDKNCSLIEQLREVQSAFQSIKLTNNPSNDELFNHLKARGLVKKYEKIKEEDSLFKIDDEKVVKVLEPTHGKEIENNFTSYSYQLTTALAEQFKQRNYHGLILCMDNDTNFVCLPSAFLLNKVCKKRYQVDKNLWDIRLKKFEERLDLILNETVELPIKQYEDSLNFRIKAIRV